MPIRKWTRRSHSGQRKCTLSGRVIVLGTEDPPGGVAPERTGGVGLQDTASAAPAGRDAAARPIPLVSSRRARAGRCGVEIPQDVIEILKTCNDPEIPVNIYDLGLIYDYQRTNGRIDVKMTLTALGCPVGPMLAEEIKTKLRELPDVEDVDVQIVFTPPWTPAKLTDDGRLVLQSMGYPV
ncbi:MAG: DUF59 domain-containing protein [Armatimonadetes bacterium]|nr:DUF59 domain-containing protein [Armatimonadota bacterium]